MSSEQRKREYLKGGITNPAEAAERRRVETATITAQRRDSALRSKRLRRDQSLGSLGGLPSRGPSPATSLGSLLPDQPSAPDLTAVGTAEEAEGAVAGPEVAAEVATAVTAAADAKPVGSAEHMEAVRALRQLLSNYEDPPVREAVEAGAVPVLVAALQPPRMDPTALEAIFEAAWAITNLAVGPYDAVKAVLPAAPLLIAYLGGGSGLAVAEQCAWALGNIAAEDMEFRQTLIANGATRPLAGLLQGAARAVAHGAGEGSPELAAGSTAAWALGNLLRGAGQEVGEFMGVDGAPDAVVSLLDSAPTDLATEVAWVLTYITAAHPAHLNRMVHLGVLPPLLRRLSEATAQMLQEDEHGRALLIPLLRSVGNMAAGGGRDALEQLLAEDARPGLLAVVDCAQSHHHGLQKEAAWVLGNLAGAPGRSGIDALKDVGAIPVLMQLLKTCPFHVRKEAAFAMANVCAGGGGGTGDTEALNWLFAADRDALRAVVTLCRSADMDAARLGLQFIEMVLRCLSTGPEAIEEVDGIDAIEAVQFGSAPPELQRMAAELVDRYYGADNEP